MVGRRRTTRWCSSQKTLLADPFSLFLSLFLTRKQQQPISTRRRERQIGTRCGKGKKGRKRNRNSIAVERVSQSRCFLSRKEQTSHHRSFLRGGQKSRRHFCLVALDVNSSSSLFSPAEPALVKYLAANTTFVPELLKTKKTEGGARVLVPGCGRGYALETLSSTFDSENVVGLEVSETARRACEAYQTERASKAKCIVDDFFTHEIPSDDDRKYDVVYDCTFLCAIQPKQRTKWAEQMKMLTKKGSRLISVIFPLGDFEGGPPFALSPELVKSLLQNDFDVEESIEVPEDDWARGKPEYLYVFRRR